MWQDFLPQRESNLALRLTVAKIAKISIDLEFIQSDMSLRVKDAILSPAWYYILEKSLFDLFISAPEVQS